MASSEMSIGGASVGPGGSQSDGPSVVPDGYYINGASVGETS